MNHQELLDGYVINYNFCRKHSVIKSTPAEMAGLQEVKGWRQLIEKSQHQKISQEQGEKEQTKTMEVKAH